MMKEINKLKRLIKKGRGLKKFHTCIDINQPLISSELRKLVKNLKEMNLKGLVLFYYTKENKNKLNFIANHISG